MTSIIVTGATGFIGGALARAFVAEGVSVRALVRSPEAPAAIALREQGVECLAGDLEAVSRIPEGALSADAMVHAATDVVMDDADRARRVGVDASVELFRRYARAVSNGTFVFISSMAVYGGIDGQASEDAALHHCGDLYADLKIDAERALAAEAPRAPHVRLVVLRFPSVYGPGSRLWTEEPLARARAGKLVAPGGGGFAFPYLYVENMVDAVRTVLERPAAHGTFDILDGVTSFGEFMQHYASAAGTPLKSVPLGLLRVLAVFAAARARLTGGRASLTPRAVKRMSRPLTNRSFRAEKALAQLGWSPKVPLEEGMRRTLEKTKR